MTLALWLAPARPRATEAVGFDNTLHVVLSEALSYTRGVIGGREKALHQCMMTSNNIVKHGIVGWLMSFAHHHGQATRRRRQGPALLPSHSYACSNIIWIVLPSILPSTAAASRL
jgi:hypothetical protein